MFSDEMLAVIDAEFAEANPATLGDEPLPTPEDAAWWASQNAYGDEVGDGERFLSCVAMPADIYEIEAIRAAEAARRDDAERAGLPGD